MLHYVQPQPAQVPPRCTKCNSPSINGQCRKQSCCCREAARCFVFVCSQLQKYNTVVCNRLLLVTSALDLPLRTNTLCSVIFSLAFTDRWRSLCRKQTCTNCYTLVHRRPSIVDRAVLQSSIDSQLFVPNCDLCLPHLHSTPPLGGPVDIAMTFGMEKLKCFGYRMVKIF